MISEALQGFVDAVEDEIHTMFDDTLREGISDIVILLDGPSGDLRWVNRKAFLKKMPTGLKQGKLKGLLAEPVGPPGGFWLIVTAPGEVGVIRVLRAIMGRGGVC